MGRKPLLQARVEESTKSAVQDYAEQNDCTQSEAVRRLIHSGLAQKGYKQDGSRSPLVRLASLKTVIFGTVLLALAAVVLAGGLASPDIALATTALGTILSGLGLLTLWTAVLAQLALARPLRGLVLNTSEVDA